MPTTLTAQQRRDLELRYDGPISPQHLEPEAERKARYYRSGIATNQGLADQFDRAAELASNSDDRIRHQRNAAWHRAEVVRLIAERDAALGLPEYQNAAE